MKNLVIVESPAKAKTIKKYLGPQYQVLASYGHVRDLVPKEGSVDPENGFAMNYQNIERNKRHVDLIAKAMKEAEHLYLATDPDREGEAIAWHLVELLKKKRLLKNKAVSRIAFHQITRQAVKDAVANPRDVSMDLVNAQQARRALDFLVGFTLSPLLWRKVKAGLSAGRVQSPALRMIVEREEAIEAFKSQAYWTFHAETKAEDGTVFPSRLTHFAGKKCAQFDVTTEAVARDVAEQLKASAEGILLVKKVTKKERKRFPSAPFITSTLQQEASRKLGMTAQQTMRVAQQLYEGVDVGEGPVGLITYMRTDSVHLAQEAIDGMRAYIAKTYGDDHVPKEQVAYKSKSKNAQEAHEGIRPTLISRVPADIQSKLDKDQFRLYQLIWQRSLASQMLPARLDTVAVDLAAGEHMFRANGSVISEPGFMRVYIESTDDAPSQSGEASEGNKFLPPLTEGQKLPLERIWPEEHATEPPPRFSEASLVKSLEEHDIGRPSTYASIIGTLKSRAYVEVEKKRFRPTDVARFVNRFLTQYFTQYVDYDFTAKLEDDLDKVAAGKEAWVPLLGSFWGPFKKQVDHINATVERSSVTQQPIDEACPTCGKPLALRLGRKGSFVGCTAYPDCDYTRSNIEGTAAPEPEILEGRVCPKCSEALLIREGKYGKFIGCSAYPKCKHLESLEKPLDTGVDCPACKKGSIVQRKSRRGKVFYSCATYPDCDYALWYEPLAKPCPTCSWPITMKKVTKRDGTQRVCPVKSCDFKEDLPDDASGE
jgi:DNA topoisomerase I